MVAPAALRSITRSVAHQASAQRTVASSVCRPLSVSCLRSLHTASTRSQLQTATTANSSQPIDSNAAPAYGGSGNTITGEILGHALDLGQAWVGQQIEVPYEATISDGESVLWMSAFHHHDRICTSSPFAQALGLADRILPYSMMLFKTISMAHVDESLNVLDLSYDNAAYVRPCFVGDTVRQIFTIKHLRNTSHGDATIVTVGCELYNQRQQLVFTCDKLMLYPKATPDLRISQAPLQPPQKPRSPLLAHILYHGETLPTTNFLAPLKRGQLVLHSTARPIGASMNMQLSTSYRWTHPSIYNMQRYSNDDILVPGGLLVAATLGASSGSFFEMLYDYNDSCALINRASPVDLIGAISYVKNIRTLKEGFEEVTATTIGVKNIDVSEELVDVKFPTELFTERWKPSALEAFLQSECPVLEGKIVTWLNRTLVRQSPYSSKKNIPLL